MRPQLYRDPIHGQIRSLRIEPDQRYADCDSAEARDAWLFRELIATAEFQRLRHIRQNGLANVVFHGAEHSRFGHSLGVAELSGVLYDRIIRNMGEQRDNYSRLALRVAGLLHDLGHGPFSHNLEEVVTDFDHEVMTVRFLLEDSRIRDVLLEVDDDFPGAIAGFIDEKRREKSCWFHRLVSSQLDADRLDYALRDAYYAGLQRHGFDLERLLDFVEYRDNRIAVDRKALKRLRPIS